MKLATMADGSRDGTLIVVSDDAHRFLPAGLTMQAALDDWMRVEPMLRALAARTEAGQGEALDVAALRRLLDEVAVG